LLAVVAVAVAARLTIPLPGGTVPQSGQTLAVLVAGGLLGPVLGPVAMIVYVLAGAVGMPVFAEGRSGLEVVVGSSAGYLGGFVVAAWVMARVGVPRESGRSRGALAVWVRFAVAALVAHCVILLFGTLRLSLMMGLSESVVAGFQPFVVGALVKSAVAAALLTMNQALRPQSP